MASITGKRLSLHKYVEEHGAHKNVIINRDSIRFMLGPYWVSKRESLVTKIELDSINTAITAGYTVIIDATNLNPYTISRWEYLAAQHNVPIKHELIKVHPFIASLRDFKRGIFGGKRVGYKVIYDFYNRYKLSCAL